MTTGFLTNAKIPVVAFTAIAVAIGSAILAMIILLRYELLAPGLQYLCGANGPKFCFANVDQASTISRAPLVFVVTFVLVPTFLAWLTLPLQKAVTPNFKAGGVAALWLAFGCYLAVPLTLIYFSSLFSGSVASTDLTLFQPLSQSSTYAYSESILTALQMNKVAVAVLLGINLFGSTALSLSGPHSTISKVARVVFAAVISGTIWVLVSGLSGLIAMVSMDRNFGTTFFNPTSQPDNHKMEHIINLLQSPEIWSAAVLVCCASFWALSRRH